VGGVTFMSEEGIVFGCIFGVGQFIENAQPLYEHNTRIIRSLPAYVDYSGNLWSSEMFAVPELYPQTPFYRTQMIHFGFSVNNFGPYWQDCINQFEAILHQLYWTEVYLKMDGINYTNYWYHWMADLSVFGENPPQPIQKWKFRGGPRKFT
jgi:hypothetical protein